MSSTDLYIDVDNMSLYTVGADASHSYTIKATANNGALELATLAESLCKEDVAYGTYLPKVVSYEGKYYVLDDEAVSGYYASYTMGAEDAVQTINYTLDESIVAFVEGETVKENSATSDSWSGGQHGYVPAQNYWVRGYGFGTMSKGVYQLETYVVSNPGRGLCVRNTTGNNTSNDGCKTWAEISSVTGLQTINFLLDDEYSLVLNGRTSNDRTNQSADFDYVIIRKISDVTGQIIGAVDYSTGYLGDMTDKVTLSPGDSYYYKFINHNSGGTSNWLNWVLPVYSGEDRVLTLRSDFWEDVKAVNTGCTATIVWDNYINEMNGATIEMTVNYSSDNVFTMSSTITTSGGSNGLTHIHLIMQIQVFH